MKKSYSLRFRVFLILVVAMTSILLLIYGFQTSLLKVFYKFNKIKMVENTAETISDMINDDDLDEMLNSLQLSNEVCVRLVGNYADVVGSSGSNACVLSRLDPHQISDLYRSTVEADGSFMTEKMSVRFGPQSMGDLFIYSKLAKYQGEEVLILVASLITPLTATLDTIKSQFLLIAVVVIGITVVLAFVISRIVIKPIAQMRKAVKDLPGGNYDGSLVKSSISEIDELNSTLVLASEQINKADRAKRDLIGNVSHDLRTPLTMISGYGEMIRDLEGENTYENISVIIDEAHRLSRLVDDLLDYSKVTDGRLVLKDQEVSVSSLLDEVYVSFRVKCQLQEVDFVKNVEVDGTFKADYQRLLQVLYNFMDNALNYCQCADKRIVTGSKSVDGHCRIYVYNNGSGISEDEKELVFERYYRSRNEHRRESEGSGIGLSLAKEILLAHGFNYGVESDGKDFSLFYFDVVL